jgi:hypothetical protein
VPWNRVDVDESELVLWSFFEGERRIARRLTHEVIFDPVHMAALMWRTRVRIVLADGRRWPEWFVPHRPARMRAALEDAGWPVVELEALTYRGYFGRMLGRR